METESFRKKKRRAKALLWVNTIPGIGSVALAASAAVAAASATAARAAARLRASLVDRQRAPAILLAREGRNGVFRLGVVSELDEAEPLRPAGVPVRDHGDGVHVAVLGEEGPKIVFGGVVGKITNVQFHRSRVLFRR